jgi:hypothetical protein
MCVLVQWDQINVPAQGEIELDLRYTIRHLEGKKYSLRFIGFVHLDESLLSVEDADRIKVNYTIIIRPSKGIRLLGDIKDNFANSQWDKGIRDYGWYQRLGKKIDAVQIVEVTNLSKTVMEGQIEYEIGGVRRPGTLRSLLFTITLLVTPQCSVL